MSFKLLTEEEGWRRNNSKNIDWKIVKSYADPGIEVINTNTPNLPIREQLN